MRLISKATSSRASSATASSSLGSAATSARRRSTERARRPASTFSTVPIADSMKTGAIASWITCAMSLKACGIAPFYSGEKGVPPGGGTGRSAGRLARAAAVEAQEVQELAPRLRPVGAEVRLRVVGVGEPLPGDLVPGGEFPHLGGI